MKIKKTLLLVFLILTSAGLKANENNSSKWSFYSAVSKPNQMDLQQISDDNFFNKTSLFYMNQLKGLTFTKEEVTPGDPVQRVVCHKSDLYKAVKNIAKGLKKAIKEKEIQPDDASVKLEDAASKAIAAFYSDESAAFEELLHRNLSDYKELVSIFAQVELK